MLPVISSAIETRTLPAGATHGAPLHRRGFHWLSTWLFLVLACAGAGWFAYQFFLAPQPPLFTPTWQDAQWVQAADGNGTVAYFRDVIDLNNMPDADFVTVAANQVFRLYVNGYFIGSNATDRAQGIGARTYIFDVSSSLHSGANILGLRVANLDQQTPSVRVNFGMTSGASLSYRGTGDGWQATAQSSLVYQRYAPTSSALEWTRSTFDASSWLPVKKLAAAPYSPALHVNPLLYQRPLSTRWMSAGASHDAYFVRTISLPLQMSDAWLRIVASGPASVYINGNLDMAWDGQAPIPHLPLADYLSNTEAVVQYQRGLQLGIYNISPYLHPGTNTIAIHTTAPGLSASAVGLSTLSAALSADILTDNLHGQNNWFSVDAGWHAATHSLAGWERGSAAALAWPAPYFVSRPGVSQATYLPDSASPRDANIFPLSYLFEIVLASAAAVLGLWLLMSLLIMRRTFRSRRDALQTLSIAYLPALAFEGLLIALAREPQLPQPFPYTLTWGLALLGLVGAGYLCVWLNGRVRAAQFLAVPINSGKQVAPAAEISEGRTLRRNVAARLLALLRDHWGLLLLLALAVPMVCYGLNYEPLWQDPLTSYFAAKGIMAHGLPIMPSGFLYAKAELYSYVLALSMFIFGEQNGALRIPGIVEFLVSLPLFYAVACYFFQRRVALLATSMLAFSPYTLRWATEVRMYEQAQFMAIIVMYLFYKALQERKDGRPHYVYLAVVALILMYLSHEETFITFPALLLCILLESWRCRAAGSRLPWVMYSKHWWLAALLAAAGIGLQLSLVQLTHPLLLGTDQSQQPLIHLSSINLSYYLQLLFMPGAISAGEPWIVLNIGLAIAGFLLGIYRDDRRVIYFGILFFVSLLTLALTLSLTSDRYIYPLLPAMYVIGTQALLLVLNSLWRFVRSLVARQQFGRRSNMTDQEPPFLLMRLVLGCVTALTCAIVLVAPLLPLGNFSHFLSSDTGISYHRHYNDYDDAGQYMHQHWQKGDVVIAVAPAISILYYVGRVDYFFSLDRALYLFEKNGHITDTPTGSRPLFNTHDFRAVLAAHPRVWIITDNGGYQLALNRERNFAFPPDFHLVFEGYGAAVYFRGG
jgi:hypothetical protein